VPVDALDVLRALRQRREHPTFQDALECRHVVLRPHGLLLDLLPRKESRFDGRLLRVARRWHCRCRRLHHLRTSVLELWEWTTQAGLLLQ